MKSDKPEKSEKSEKSDKSKESDKSEKSDNPGKSDKPEKSEKSARAAKAWSEDPTPLLRAGAGFTLLGSDASATPGFDGSKSDGAASLIADAPEMGLLQEKFFANSLHGDERSILLVLQGMDSSGKGGIVRHVVGLVDPQGVQHASFKKPTPEELEHDFLWRIRKQLPTPGHIGVFDRSHYEDVLAGRVLELAAPEVIEERYRQINDFESELVAHGTTVIKVMLNISADEQKARLAERLERPDKYWKFSPDDIDSRLLWNPYQAAYQAVFEKTSTPTAPWHVVPANRKWYARLAVQRLLLDALRSLGQSWPSADFDIDEQKRRLTAT
ncbi:MAG: phosphate--nucleotide phosphotransferase [Subtercola sp.]|nr:phosphate--nucleotide phosphotransferase [Subtercola sp.]